MQQITTVIDQELCTGCGLCVRVCPDETIGLVDERAEVIGDQCFQCGHCLAVCPVGAISVAALDPAALVFKTFTLDQRWLPWGEFDPALLVRLLASRRSCRNYLPQPVSRDLLLDLVKAGTTAPSGTNSQQWTFTILDKREQVERLGGAIAGFFIKLNRQATNPLLRLLAAIFLKDALGKYYRSYYRAIEQGLKKWRDEGRDLLFHGAPALIVVGSGPGASCPAEDALLASQNILLTAHAMGLGSCLIGYAVAALERQPDLKKILGMPASEQVYAVIALGFPGEKYQRMAGRKAALIRFGE